MSKIKIKMVGKFERPEGGVVLTERNDKPFDKREERKLYLGRFVLGRRADASLEIGLSLKDESEEAPQMDRFEIVNYYQTSLMGREKKDVLSEFGERLMGERVFENFVFSYAKKFGIYPGIVKKMLADEELGRTFLELVEFDLLGDEADSEVGEKYARLSKSFQRQLVKYSRNKKELDVSELFLDIRRGRRLMKVTELLLKSEEFGDDFYQEKKGLDEQYAKGEIDESGYLDALEELYSRCVDESGNEELKSLWGATDTDQEIAEEFKSVVVETAAYYLAAPVSTVSETRSAVDEVGAVFGATNYSVDFAREGAATLRVADFSIDLEIYRDPQSGDFVYFVTDDYLNSGKVGPLGRDELPEVVDARRIDGYVTKRIGKLSSNPQDLESIKNVPDDSVEMLGIKLLGQGSARGFDITGNGRKIMDGFVGLLLKQDDKYLTVESKVRNLNRYLNTDQRIDALRASLVNGEEVSLSNLFS